MSEIIVRPLETMDEIIAAEEVQRITWNMNDLEIVPAHVFHALQDSGAILLGAFDDDQLVGFVFGVLGADPAPEQADQTAAARLKMYSVMTGVLPGYQQHDVGYRLKMGQRDLALKFGIDLITWTYDPLESLNARFNIGKLGVICRRYRRHFHGNMSGINTGLQTDRFEVEWLIAGDRVAARADHKWQPPELKALLAGGATLVNGASVNEADLPVPPADTVPVSDGSALVEIPSNFQAIKRADIQLARQWRAHTRAIFEGLFGSGFAATDFVQNEDDGGRSHSYYLLTHQDIKTNEN